MRRALREHLAKERHKQRGLAWLRAAVLGANDGLVSTASLVVGVASASHDRAATLVAGIAGLTAGALSMAAGEYVSVSSQRDTERADLERERLELEESPEAERAELARIYRKRGLSEQLAEKVADELSQLDRLAIHARDELGIDPDDLANPYQAALVSAATFAVGAAIPLVVVLFAPATLRIAIVVAFTLAGLLLLGTIGARLGGAPPARAAIRVFVGGALALAVSVLVGRLTGSVF